MAHDSNACISGQLEAQLGSDAQCPMKIGSVAGFSDAQTSRRADIQRCAAGRWQAGADEVAEEVPVALEYNGVSHAVMLATPDDLEEFALGFSLTEDIVASRADVRGIDVFRGARGITVQLEIASSAFAALKDRRRNLAGRTGCGLCGTETLLEAVRMPAPLPANPTRFSADAVHRALRTLAVHQPLYARTGATHAAAWCDGNGAVMWLREDVGRHNALDKLVGALAFNNVDAAPGFIAVTSRASYEMAGKTVRCGAPLLAAVSGVTGLAIDLAEASGLTLAGFARGESLNVYSHAERLSAPTER